MPSWLSESLRVTLWGMGLVFLVLGGLWAIVTALVRLEPPSADGASEAAPATVAGERVDPRLLAAVVIAVRAHIRVRRKQAAPAMRAHAPGSLPSRWTSIGRGRQVRSG